MKSSRRRRVLGAAYGDLGLLLVVHAELVAAFEPWDDFANVVDVDQERPVGAPEDRGVEHLEKFFEGAGFGLAFYVWSGNRDHAFVDGGEADIFLID